MTKLRFFTLVLLLFSCLTATAQSFDLREQRVRATYLQGLWHFHTGDDPAWASKDFDDSHWPLLRSYETWLNQGYPNYSGIAWYRFQVTVPGDFPDLALTLPPINNCYEVFANGIRIGTYGKMPPDPVPYFGGVRELYSLPAIPHDPGSDYKVEIAIRVWAWPTYVGIFGGGPLYGGAAIGSREEMDRLYSQGRNSLHWSLSSDMILSILQSLAALGGFTLYLLRRNAKDGAKEYVWFALVMTANTTEIWLSLSYLFSPWPIQLHNLLDAFVVGPGLTFAELAFYFYLLKGRRNALFWLAIASVLVAIPFSLFSPLMNLKLWHVYLVQDLLGLPADLWILWMLFGRARSNGRDARLLAIPVALQKGVVLFQQASILTYSLGWQTRFRYNIAIVDQPFQIQLVQLVNGLFLITMLSILVQRFSRSQGEEERFFAEFSGARSIQQFLIPDNVPSIPGFRIEAEYRPAREVGGDFFQVLPDPDDGSVLIVVGDVAGKGLEAGMLASLVVGSIRTAATFTRDPGRILWTLNNRLDRRGLATCLILRIDQKGDCVLVNAGHLPPFRNGKELPMEGSFPLGTILNMDFPEMQFHLDPADQLLLMTDGIVEAQKPSGELFGFDRTGEMIAQKITAFDLASAAQAHGQTDDITVVTVARL